MESKEQIKKRLKDKYGVELTPNSDFTKLPDKILANALCVSADELLK